MTSVNRILTPENIKYTDIDTPYLKVDQSNIESYILEISMCISTFNKEIKWDKMWDLNEAIKRIKDGDVFFILIENNVVHGFFWIKKMKNDRFFIYNLFMTNKKSIKKYSGVDFISTVHKKFYKNKTFIGFIDEWNNKSKTVAFKLGFTDLNG